MSAAMPEIIDQPQLSFMDGSNQEAIRFFDALAIDFPDAVQAAAKDEDLAKGVAYAHPEKVIPVDSEGIQNYRRQQAASALSTLLEKSGGGRFLDYDGPTWVAVMADEAYHAASEKVKQSRESSVTLATDKRTTALRGLAIYAHRRHTFAAQVKTQGGQLQGQAGHALVSSLPTNSPQQHQAHPGAA